MPKPSQESYFWEITKRGIDRALKELSVYHIKNEYVFFNTDIDGSDAISFIGQDSYQSGVVKC